MDMGGASQPNGATKANARARLRRRRRARRGPRAACQPRAACRPRTRCQPADRRPLNTGARWLHGALTTRGPLTIQSPPRRPERFAWPRRARTRAVGLIVAGVSAAISTADGRSSRPSNGIALTVLVFTTAGLLARLPPAGQTRPWSRVPAVMTPAGRHRRRNRAAGRHRPGWGWPAWRWPSPSWRGVHSRQPAGSYPRGGRAAGRPPVSRLSLLGQPSRSWASVRASSRDTCIWEMPTRSRSATGSCSEEPQQQDLLLPGRQLLEQRLE